MTTTSVMCGPCVAIAPSRAAQTGRGSAGRPTINSKKKAPSSVKHVAGGRWGSSSSSSSAAAGVRTAAVPPEAVEAAASAASTDSIDTAQFAASSMADALSDTGIAEWQIYFGFVTGLSPFVIAAYEFGKRILIQRQCELCQGSGLIQKGRYARKCTSCGGFLPWQSWGQFLTSEAGNGGTVRVPKGQSSVFYDVDAALQDSKRQVAERAAEDDVKDNKEEGSATTESSR
jgi:hypothetical protein